MEEGKTNEIHQMSKFYLVENVILKSKCSVKKQKKPPKQQQLSKWLIFTNIWMVKKNVIHKQTVSLYHISEWLDVRDTSSWDRKPAYIYKREREKERMYMEYCLFIIFNCNFSSCGYFFCVGIQVVKDHIFYPNTFDHTFCRHQG